MQNLTHGYEVLGGTIYIGRMRKDGIKIHDIMCTIDYDPAYTEEAKARCLANAEAICEGLNRHHEAHQHQQQHRAEVDVRHLANAILERINAFLAYEMDGGGTICQIEEMAKAVAEHARQGTVQPVIYIPYAAKRLCAALKGETEEERIAIEEVWESRDEKERQYWTQLAECALYTPKLSTSEERVKENADSLQDTAQLVEALAEWQCNRQTRLVIEAGGASTYWKDLLPATKKAYRAWARDVLALIASHRRGTA